MRRPKVTKDRPQAMQWGYDGRILYRWYVHAEGPREKVVITWAATADEAKEKGEARGLKVTRVAPAPSLVD